MEEANLQSIPFLKKLFGVEVGLSDHTNGMIAPIVAAALGGSVIEKHIVLDHSISGPDASFSLDEKEFTEMVHAVRQAEMAVGKADYFLSEPAISNRRFGRSLFAVKDIRQGEPFTEENVKSIRPAFGMHPKHLKELLGTCAKRDFRRGDPLII
jgi:pseudaminic acid synthase